MLTVDDIKRTNLQSIIDDHYGGVRRRLEMALGKHDGALARYFARAETTRRSIGIRLCRQIERLHNLPDGWMRTLHNGQHSFGELTLEEQFVLYAWRRASDAVRQAVVELMVASSRPGRVESVGEVDQSDLFDGKERHDNNEPIRLLQ